MQLPCEYCGKFTEADEFMRMAVPPCCPDCTWHLRAKLAMLVVIAVAYGAFIHWVWS